LLRRRNSGRVIVVTAREQHDHQHNDPDHHSGTNADECIDELVRALRRLGHENRRAEGRCEAASATDGEEIVCSGSWISFFRTSGSCHLADVDEP
jgi:hypothetical protein